MKPQTKKIDNQTKRNVKKEAMIKIRLIKNGKTQQDISKDLDISAQAVNRAIKGLSTITRVDNWLKENLGV